MSRRPQRRHLALAAVLCALATPSSATGQALILDGRLNERVIMVPAGPAGEVRLETTLFRPSGTGPFPLLVINHGKQPGDPRLQRRDRFLYLASAFVRRGYAVMVPMRSGFAGSTGVYVEHGCDMTANGYAQARDVRATIDYARRQSWIDGERIVVAGQSYGGLASMALAAQDVPGVRGVLNFAGGLRVDGGGCDWQSALVKAFADFGASNRIASLWMYGSNDSFFGPQLVARLYRSFVQSGGTATLRTFGPFKRDAHAMLASRDGEQVWLAQTEAFLRRVGMPADEVYTVAGPALPARTDFAPIDDVAAVPYLPDSGRDAYRAFLDRMTPRAFALSASGAWGWAEEGEQPDQRAVAACQVKSSQPCRLYTVDDYVVWPGPTTAGKTE